MKTDQRELRTASARLALQFAGIILALFVLLGAVVYIVVSTGQTEAAKRALADASQVDSVHDAPHDLLVTVLLPQGRDVSPNLPEGLPDGPVKNAIFGGNSARLYKYKAQASYEQLSTDKLAQIKAEYQKEQVARNNKFYGFVAKQA